MKVKGGNSRDTLLPLTTHSTKMSTGGSPTPKSVVERLMLEEGPEATILEPDGPWVKVKVQSPVGGAEVSITAVSVAAARAGLAYVTSAYPTKSL